MSGVLVYYDHELCVQLATSLIGSEVSLTHKAGDRFGFNFKVLVERERSSSISTTTNVQSILPEVLIEAIYDAVPHKLDSLKQDKNRFVASTTTAFSPGTIIILNSIKLIHQPSESGKQIFLSGEKCDSFRIKDDDYFLQAFVQQGHGSLVTEHYNQPMDVLGVLRWRSPYSVPGCTAFNLGLRVGALWLR
ncbi:hypothetical protein K8T06_16625 [bacterium]|nr:hypothetical protein [bacterium]